MHCRKTAQPAAVANAQRSVPVALAQSSMSPTVNVEHKAPTKGTDSTQLSMSGSVPWSDPSLHVASRP
jgi:hypothetical protein